MDIRNPEKISPCTSADPGGSTEADFSIDVAISTAEADPTLGHHDRRAMTSISLRSFTTCNSMGPEVFPLYEINGQMECSLSGPSIGNLQFMPSFPLCGGGDPFPDTRRICLDGQPLLQGFLHTAANCSSPSDGETRKTCASGESCCCRNGESSGKTDTMLINGSTSSQKDPLTLQHSSPNPQIKKAATRNTASNSLDMNGAHSLSAETGNHGFKGKSSAPERENHDINNLVDNPEDEEHPSNRWAKRRMDDCSHILEFIDGSYESKKQAESPRCGEYQGCSFAVEESSWIRRWRCRVKAAAPTESRPDRIGLPPGRENREVPVQKHKGKDFPSAAAMALMGKAARSSRPLEFQRRGQLVEWNIK